MQDFTPLAGLAGGILIGISAAVLLLGAGRTAGVSGLLEAALKPTSSSFAVGMAFLVGLPIGALVVAATAPGLVPSVQIKNSWPLLVCSGLLVGFGARLANGCTSGHGVCGLPRLSARSWIATATFMAVTAVTVYVSRHAI